MFAIPSFEPMSETISVAGSSVTPWRLFIHAAAASRKESRPS